MRCRRQSKAWTSWIRRTETALEEFLTNPPAKLTEIDVHNRKTFELERPADFDAERPNYLRRSYVMEYRRRRASMQSGLKNARENRQELEKRLAEWRPA